MYGTASYVMYLGNFFSFFVNVHIHLDVRGAFIRIHRTKKICMYVHTFDIDVLYVSIWIHLHERIGSISL